MPLRNYRASLSCHDEASPVYMESLTGRRTIINLPPPPKLGNGMSKCQILYSLKTLRNTGSKGQQLQGTCMAPNPGTTLFPPSCTKAVDQHNILKCSIALLCVVYGKNGCTLFALRQEVDTVTVEKGLTVDGLLCQINALGIAPPILFHQSFEDPEQSNTLPCTDLRCPRKTFYARIEELSSHGKICDIPLNSRPLRQPGKSRIRTHIDPSMTWLSSHLHFHELQSRMFLEA
eukprot:scaffold35732_cov17-Tisochrysis_lutea.AAC.1